MERSATRGTRRGGSFTVLLSVFQPRRDARTVATRHEPVENGGPGVFISYVVGAPSGRLPPLSVAPTGLGNYENKRGGPAFAAHGLAHRGNRQTPQLGLTATLRRAQGRAATPARLLGVHAGMGSKILKGDRSLTLDPIRKLAARFKVGPEGFFP